MLDRLIAFLRATLNASRVQQHPLATEFERISDYLALMAIRMGPRLTVTLDLPEALRALPVPPLLLQPLVENCIKHGLEPKVAGGRIDVSARIEAGFLLLAVRDTGLGLSAAGDSSGSHFGLAQVRERLATLYGSPAGLVIENTGDAEGGARVTLRLPLAADGQPQALITPTLTVATAR
jgi:LytS/YehU family sensor histidine kinase